MAKRLTAEERREKWAKDEERYGRTFLRRMAEAKTFGELWALANDGRDTKRPGDRYHHWLGCALNRNPYEGAPDDVREAIEAAMARTKWTTTSRKGA